MLVTVEGFSKPNTYIRLWVQLSSLVLLKLEVNYLKKVLRLGHGTLFPEAFHMESVHQPSLETALVAILHA